MRVYLAGLSRALCLIKNENLDINTYEIYWLENIMELNTRCKRYLKESRVNINKFLLDSDAFTYLNSKKCDITINWDQYLYKAQNCRLWSSMNHRLQSARSFRPR